jgi:hypothetical protein
MPLFLPHFITNFLAIIGHVLDPKALLSWKPTPLSIGHMILCRIGILIPERSLECQLEALFRSSD